MEGVLFDKGECTMTNGSRNQKTEYADVEYPQGASLPWRSILLALGTAAIVLLAGAVLLWRLG